MYIEVRRDLQLELRYVARVPAHVGMRFLARHDVVTRVIITLPYMCHMPAARGSIAVVPRDNLTPDQGAALRRGRK